VSHTMIGRSALFSCRFLMHALSHSPFAPLRCFLRSLHLVYDAHNLHPSGNRRRFQTLCQ
jgi:hypothetical protein